ncbi:MAG: glycosyltransferase [Candidatus Angelobacter sp.]
MNRIATPIASVVMTAWNSELYLDQAVASILTQTFSEFEFIVVDDGSTDRTAALLTAYKARDSRMSVFSRNHQGRINALNFACERARGKYLFNLDADDVALPTRIEQQFAFMEENPDTALLGTASRLIWADGRLIRERIPPPDDASIRQELMTRACICHTSIAMRKEAFVAAGGYRAPFRYGHDYDLFFRIADYGELANLDEVLVLHRIHGNQSSALSFEEMILSGIAVQVAARLRAEKQSDASLLEDENAISRATLKQFDVTEEEIDKITLFVIEHHLALALSPERPSESERQADAFIALAKEFCGHCNHQTLFSGDFPLLTRVLNLSTHVVAAG